MERRGRVVQAGVVLRGDIKEAEGEGGSEGDEETLVAVEPGGPRPQGPGPRPQGPGPRPWGLACLLPCLPRPLAALLSVLRSSLATVLPAQPGHQDQVWQQLREVIVQHHRTMFYTVTVRKAPAAPAPSLHRPALQWQCASSLLHSRGLATRAERRAPAYYSLAFIDPD